MLVHQWTSIVDVSGLGAVSLACWRRQGDGTITKQGKAHHDNVLALVYICTFGEAWLRARFVTRSWVACWMLRCRERRNMATPSAIDLLIRSSRAEKRGAPPRLYRCIVALIHIGGWMGKQVRHPFVCEGKPGSQRPRFDACSKFCVAGPDCQIIRPCQGLPLGQ